MYTRIMEISFAAVGVLLFCGTSRQAQEFDKWVRITNTHGWSLSYPASWEAYVMQAPDSGPELSIRESDNVNFSGPKDCYERKERCGIFQISLDFVKANQQFDFSKYVDGETQNSGV